MREKRSRRKVLNSSREIKRELAYGWLHFRYNQWPLNLASCPMSQAQFFKYHLFVCTNHREELMSCSDFDAVNARAYMKKEIKRRGLDGEGKVRINQAGCLGRCLSGPVVVIYPEEVWYTYVDEHDLDEIIEQHLQNDRIVTRLLLEKKDSI